MCRVASEHPMGTGTREWARVGHLADSASVAAAAAADPCRNSRTVQLVCVARRPGRPSDAEGGRASGVGSERVNGTLRGHSSDDATGGHLSPLFPLYSLSLLS